MRTLAALVFIAAVVAPWSGNAFLLRGGGSNGTPPSDLTTMTVVNESGSTIGNGFVRFAHPFKQGDIPSGQAPVFKDDSGNVLPYSWGAKRAWDETGQDGSLMTAMFLVCKVPSTANNASATIHIQAGGSWPAAGSRARSEVYSQNYVVNATAAPITGANIVNEGAWLDDPTISGSNNAEQFNTLDGGCGREDRYLVHLSPTKDGTAHGQLEDYEYVTALTASGGALGGFLKWGRITQPWYNYDTPAKNVRAFSAISYTTVGPGGSGTATVNFATLPTATTFTATGGSPNFVLAGATNPFYFGVEVGAGNQILAGYVTTTGTLPTGLDANTLYFASVSSSTSHNATFGTNGIGGGVVTPSDAGTGTHTFNPAFAVVHFGSIVDADPTTVRSRFFQGAGSIAADPRLRPKFNQTYWEKSHVLGPIDLAQIGTVTSNECVAQASSCNGGAPYAWNSASIGPQPSDRHTTGDADVGPLWPGAMRHFYIQDQIDDVMVRQVALSQVHDGMNFRDHATRQYPNLTNTTYSGGTDPVPAPSSAQQQFRWSGFGPGPNGSWTPPPSSTYQYVFDDADCSHCSENFIYAYLLTGEAFVLDLGIEAALGGQMHVGGGTNHRNPLYPVAAYGIATARDAENRDAAWSFRREMLAGRVAPDPYFDGSHIGKLYDDLTAANCSWPVNQALPNLGTYAIAKGYWTMGEFNSDNSIKDVLLGESWQFFYNAHIAAWAADLYNNADCKTWAKNFATKGLYYQTTFSGWALNGYTEHNVNGSDTGASNANAMISSDAQWGPSVPGPVTWAASSPMISLSNASSTGWTPTDGDKFLYGNFQGVICGYLADTPYYLKNTVNTGGSNYTFDLSATVGGAALPPPSGATPSGCHTSGTFNTAFQPAYVLPQPTSVTSTGVVSANNANAYIANGRALWNRLKAQGITALDGTAVDALITDANTRMNSVGTPDWNTYPRFAFGSAF